MNHARAQADDGDPASTIVLLHPIGLDGGCWRFLHSPRLSGAVHYDLLWHGGRARPEQTLTIERFAEDVVRHVSGRLDIIGVSMGAYIARQIAIRWPDRVRSLMSACASAGSSDGGKALIRRAETAERDGMDAVLEPTLVRWFSADGLNSPGHPGVDYARRRLLHDDPLSFGSSWRALAEDRSSAALSSVSAPTTVLHASDDASVSLDASRRVAQLIPNARLETIPGPHLAPLESFTEFETAVLSHLDWVDRSRPSRAPSLSHRK